MADKYADENADFARRIAEGKLSEIDTYVVRYMFRTVVEWFDTIIAIA